MATQAKCKGCCNVVKFKGYHPITHRFLFWEVNAKCSLCGEDLEEVKPK